MKPGSEVTEIKGVGPELAKRLESAGIRTVSELLEYLPRRYDDFSLVAPISAIKPGNVTIKARIKQAKGRYARRGLHVTEAIASDETGSVRLVWFNQPYRAQALKNDRDYFISGDFGLRRQRLCIQNPAVEAADSFNISTARIVPVYPEKKGLKSVQLRKIIKQALPMLSQLPETLPDWLIKEHGLVSRSEALAMMHVPETASDIEKAKRRLGFEEVFGLTLAASLNKLKLSEEVSVAIPFDETVAREFVGHLPFTLTDQQRQAVWQIYRDMSGMDHPDVHNKIRPMNRLLEGDVGSGKTVVAAMAALMVMKHDYQTVMLAPTELLARQHADTLHSLLKPLGMAGKLCLLVGGMKSAQKKSALESIRNGEAGFIVGTHALLEGGVDMHKLGLVVIDEQHRFGVEQRKILQKKAGHMPHVLSMTATPIPRSLALTLYGELDISVIASKPDGRLPVITKVVSPNSRTQLYERVDSELSAGRQMFVVAPLIEDSEFLAVKSAEQVYQELVRVFKHRSIGLLHGKLKAEEKDSIMRRFVRHELDILVSTTVIEVGVDVPNATVMIIENAERFGLAQIHQLRGRVGRSSHQGYAFLVMGDSSDPSRRLRALEQSSDGFALAEMDLELRGPGAIYGTMQHGRLDLRIAKLSDVKLIAEAKAAAKRFIQKNEPLEAYPHLSARVRSLQAVTTLN